MAGFMVMQVWQEAGATFETPDGQCFLPLSYGEGLEMARLDRDGEPAYNENGPTDPDVTWWCEYSAPGYMDRTDPVYGATAREAIEACWALYGDDESSEERFEYAAMLWEARKLDRKGA